jgi:uncharacterized protein
MRVVLDTNVLVSGLLNPHGPPGAIVRMVADGELSVSYDARVLNEYREVLLRPLFPFRVEEVDALLEQISAAGEAVASLPLGRRLPDPDDEVFLEVAIAARADCLITGNLQHYPEDRRSGVRLVTPREFIDEYRSSG